MDGQESELIGALRSKTGSNSIRRVKNFNKEALAGLLRFLIGLALLLFLPAWTLRYWQAWIFLSVFSSSVLAITIYLMEKDPKLLQRRMKAGPVAEKEKSQRIIQWVTSIAFIALFVFSAIDYRFEWSTVPLYTTAAGDVLVALGLLIIFFVFRVNTFTSGIIEVDTEQKVVSTGLYALVRHPMYIGALVMLLGVPPALGSWWGLCAVVVIAVAIGWRLVDEENFLTRKLPGYSEYRDKVKYRLIPFIW
jgi:protein-S-isoprenylcysteine O-methyltransferase Ste14